MNIRIAAIFIFFTPICTQAATKSLECPQTNDKGVVQVIKAVIADESDKAEVNLHATTAECAATDSCPTSVYRKETLPTVIRLTSTTYQGSISYQTIIDIDRTNLNVVTRTSLKMQGTSHETTFSGSCTLKVDNTKKLL